MTPTSAGGTTNPIQDFSDCHVGIARALDELAGLATRTRPDTGRAEIAGRLQKFFTEVVFTHHQEEEAELFPAVLADAAHADERKNVEALTRRLVTEHRRVEDLYKQLAPALSALVQGEDLLPDAALVGRLVSAYREHARFEEDVFLPMAQDILARNSNHMAALGLSLHIRHAADDVRRRFGFI